MLTKLEKIMDIIDELGISKFETLPYSFVTGTDKNAMGFLFSPKDADTLTACLYYREISHRWNRAGEDTIVYFPDIQFEHVCFFETNDVDICRACGEHTRFCQDCGSECCGASPYHVD